MRQLRARRPGGARVNRVAVSERCIAALTKLVVLPPEAAVDAEWIEGAWSEC